MPVLIKPKESPKPPLIVGKPSIKQPIRTSFTTKVYYSSSSSSASSSSVSTLNNDNNINIITNNNNELQPNRESSTQTNRHPVGAAAATAMSKNEPTAAKNNTNTNVESGSKSSSSSSMSSVIRQVYPTATKNSTTCPVIKVGGIEYEVAPIVFIDEHGFAKVYRSMPRVNRSATATATTIKAPPPPPTRTIVGAKPSMPPQQLNNQGSIYEIMPLSRQHQQAALTPLPQPHPPTPIPYASRVHPPAVPTPIPVHAPRTLAPSHTTPAIYACPQLPMPFPFAPFLMPFYFYPPPNLSNDYMNNSSIPNCLAPAAQAVIPTTATAANEPKRSTSSAKKESKEMKNKKNNNNANTIKPVQQQQQQQPAQSPAQIYLGSPLIMPNPYCQIRY